MKRGEIGTLPRRRLFEAFRALPALGMLVAASGCSGPNSSELYRGAATESGVSEGAAGLVLELAIGEDARRDERDYQFAGISDLLATPAGDIWVIDGGSDVTASIRIFDSEGRFVRRVGRDGAGPGEYSSPYGLGLTRDGRVVMRDYFLADRLTFYGEAGDFHSTVHLGVGVRWLFAGSGALAVDAEGIIWLPFRDRPSSGDRPVRYLRVRPDGAVMDTVSVPQLPPIDRDSTTLVAPYEPRRVWTWIHQGAFAVARTDRYHVEILPPTGVHGGAAGATLPPALSTVVRDIPPVAIQAGERAAIMEQLAARQAAAEGKRIPEIPKDKPPIRALQSTDDGRLLVMVHGPSHFENGQWAEPTAYDVHADDGEFLGRLIFPDSFTMYRMEGDLVWGVFRGEFGVESIRRYRIVPR